MPDYYEIDFLDVETDSSGDAISVRYEVNGNTSIHVVDGGYQVTGDAIVKHLQTHYAGATRVDHVVVTHCDRDHTGGLRTVLEQMEVGILWMLRPWEYTDLLLPYFPTYSSADRLRSRLRNIYPNLVALEEIALERGIPIEAPFQGSVIGAFTVLAPSFNRYLDLIIASEKTPESEARVGAVVATESLGERLMEALRKAVQYVQAQWGVEQFSNEPTSAENEMSIVQFGNLAGQKILLTGDAGIGALTEAADYAPFAGISLPGIDRFQVPHHGSRRNVSTEVLDRWLGETLDTMPVEGQEKFIAIVSSAKADEDHPRKAVERAMIHRGARLLATESQSIRLSGGSAPKREDWGPVPSRPYPETQEA